MYLFDNDFESEHMDVSATLKRISVAQDFLLNSAANENNNNNKNALPKKQ